MRNLRWIVVPALLLATGCHGKKSQPKEPERIVEEKPKPKPPPPPPPVCVLAGEAQSLVGMVEADDASVKFCVSDGAESNKCYGVDLEKKKYSELDTPPTGQSSVLDPDPAKVEPGTKDFKVCVGDECKTLKPKGLPKSDNPLDVVINSTGTVAAILLGNAEKGKGTVEVWDVTKGKKAVTIKYPKGDYKCGTAQVLGNTIYISASVCAGPSARGWLYNMKGKKIADVGGKEFGTYETVPVQLTETTWAFLEETGAAVAIQDVATGKVAQTIDLGGVWGGDGTDLEAPPPVMGNPGESALVRGGEGKLVVVTGGPNPGSVGVIELADGTLMTSVMALACEGGGTGTAMQLDEGKMGKQDDDDAEDEDEMSEDSDQGGE